MLDSHYVAAILVWATADGADDAVIEWLREREFVVQPMVAGLLVTGALSAFNSAFAVDLSTQDPPMDLPIPAAIRSKVSSVTISSPPKLMGLSESRKAIGVDLGR